MAFYEKLLVTGAVMFNDVFFVSRCSTTNVGDRLSSPYLYFYKDFPRARQVEIHLGDKPSWRRMRMRALRIANAKLIIVGGGGLLGQTYFDHDMSFWGSVANSVKVLWGVGHNSHDIHAVDSANPSALGYVGVTGFHTIGIRDWGTGFGWVPCASCMHGELSKPPTEKGGLVAALHHETRSSNTYINALIGAVHEPVDVIFNDYSPELFIGKLRSARAVVTNSYHAAYWATLMGKRVVAIGGGSKLRLLRHSPVLATVDNWVHGIDQAVIHHDALTECRERTLAFRHLLLEVYGGAERRFVSAPSTSIPRNPIQERSRDLAPIYSAPVPLRAKVPKVVHFVFGLVEDYGGRPFNVMHHNAVMSAAMRLKPEEILFHYRYEPDTEWYRRIRPLITPRKLTTRSDYDEERHLHFAHQADFVRLQLLRDIGGVYLDLDTIVVNSFDAFLNCEFTIGIQGMVTVDGLSNAVLISAKNTAFVAEWLKYYDDFSDRERDRFSVRLPYAMWRSGRVAANVQPYDRFHWPLGDDLMTSMFQEDRSFPNAVCHHLWESMSYPRYFPRASCQDTIEWLKRGTSTYSRLVRDLL